MKATAAWIIAVSIAAGIPGAAFSGDRVNWAAAGKPAPLYPYKNLPGVVDPAKQPVDEKFNCRIGVAYPRWFDGIHYRGLPKQVYVCNQDGMISSSARPPNWSYWQYNDRN